MRTSVAIAAFMLASLAASAQAPHDYPRMVAEMKERVEHAKPDDRDKLIAELIRYEVYLGRQQFTGGDNAGGSATLVDIERHARECQEAAVRTGKNLKQTDITLREATRVLDDYRREADVEIQAMLKHTSDALESARGAILNRMFAPPEKKK